MDETTLECHAHHVGHAIYWDQGISGLPSEYETWLNDSGGPRRKVVIDSWHGGCQAAVAPWPCSPSRSDHVGQALCGPRTKTSVMEALWSMRPPSSTPGCKQPSLVSLSSSAYRLSWHTVADDLLPWHFYAPPHRREDLVSSRSRRISHRRGWAGTRAVQDEGFSVPT